MILSTILQAAGALVATVGIGLIYPPAGVIVGGAFLILIGFALGKR